MTSSFFKAHIMLSFLFNRNINQRSKNNILIFVFIFFAAVSILTQKVQHNHNQPDQSVTQDIPQNDDFGKFNNKTFTVIYIVDGDTIDIDIPDGKYPKTPIRLLGVDTPETKKPGTPVMFFGPHATQFTTEKSLNKNVVIILDTVSKTRDRYGRVLAYVQLPNGDILNESLIVNGMGYADPRFAHSQIESYILMQSHAIESEIGLWKDISADQLPQWFKGNYPHIFENIQANHKADK